MRNLVDESASFRSELLAFRLATLPALKSLEGDYSDAVAKACRDMYDQATNAYFLGLYKLITDWAGGIGVFSDELEIMDLIMSIAKLDRNACCGQDFSDARRFAALSCFEPNTGDARVCPCGRSRL